MAKDIFHDVVRHALEKDGWTITHDPLPIVGKEIEGPDYMIDLGAEKLIIAEKGFDKIAVEIKSFIQPSFAHEFHRALGQYLTYLDGLQILDVDRKLYLAIPLFAKEILEEHPFLIGLIRKYSVRFVIFEPKTEVILSWEN